MIENIANGKLHMDILLISHLSTILDYKGLIYLEEEFESYDDIYTTRKTYNDVIGNSNYNCGIKDCGVIYLFSDWVIKRNRLSSWFSKSDIIDGIVVGKSQKAILFEYNGDTVWIPRSQMKMLE
jgi:hypothetical protein